MSLTISLVGSYPLTAARRETKVVWKLNFRKQTLTLAAEIFTLVVMTVGLFTLFLGLSVI